MGVPHDFFDKWVLRRSYYTPSHDVFLMSKGGAFICCMSSRRSNAFILRWKNDAVQRLHPLNKASQLTSRHPWYIAHSSPHSNGTPSAFTRCSWYHLQAISKSEANRNYYTLASLLVETLIVNDFFFGTCRGIREWNTFRRRITLINYISKGGIYNRADGF